MIFEDQIKLAVSNTMLKASNLILSEGQKEARLTADVAAAATTIYVNNYEGFADNDYLLIGNWGEETSEITQINDASVDLSIVVGTLKYDHTVDTPVTKIPYDKIQFFRSTSDVDANTTPTSLVQLGSNVSIMAYSNETFYQDNTNSTGYAYVRFANTELTSYSKYSDAVPYTGNAYNTLLPILEEAVAEAGLNMGNKHCRESQLIADANEAQEFITRAQDWVFELIKDNTSIATTENENKYALSSLTYALKYPDSYQGLLNVRIGNKVLDYVSPNDMDKNFENTSETTLAAQATSGATSITLTDSYEFADSGSLYLGADVVTYTAKDDSTGILTGIPASGTGSISTTMAAGASVWQGINPAVPDEYTIFNGQIILDHPVDDSVVGYKIKVKYLKKLSRFTKYSDTVEIPFFEAITKFVTYKILNRKNEKENAKSYKDEFMEILQINSQTYKLPTLQSMVYYAYDHNYNQSSRNEIVND